MQQDPRAAPVRDARRRVLFVDGSPGVGGATRVLATVLDHLDPVAAASVVAFGPASGVGEAVGAGADLLAPIELPLLTFAAGARGALPLLLRYVRGAFALSRLLRSHRPALVWANGLMGALHASLPARLAGVPLVWHVHDLLPVATRNRPFVRLVSASSAAIVCVSEATRRRLAEFGVPARKCHVVHNTLPSPVGEPAGGGSGPNHRIVAAGALTPLKGHDVLVEAMRDVVRRFPDATLEIAGAPIFPGDAQFAEGLRAAVRAAGMDRNVRFLGFVGDVERRIDEAAIVVHPSSEEETFGLVPLEAMARGKPVVASSVGGIPEVVEDGRTGVLVPPKDAGALARAIVGLLDDAGRRERLGAEGRRVARERFGPDRFVDGLNRVTRGLVGADLFSVAGRGGEPASNRASASS